MNTDGALADKQEAMEAASDRPQRTFRDSWVYRFIVEAFAMNSFSLAITMPGELIFARMSFPEYAKTRIAASIINTLTGRPYGIWRDYIFRVGQTTQASPWLRKYISDTLAFMSFQLPLYWISMTIGGARLKEMLMASLPITIIAGLTGRPYGFYLERVRSFFRIRSAV
jgi:hypothetical protein